jgi:hypothetical protein
VRRVYGDPPTASVLANLDRRLFNQYYLWFYGPGRRFAYDVKCRHEYGMFDSCPGCDANEENFEGPWAGTEVSA